MGPSFTLFRVLGIPVNLSYSWFIILGVATYVLSRDYGESWPTWSVAEQWGIGAITSLLFFISVLVHELSHSILSKSSGIPVKGITLFIFGGISELSKEAHKPSLEFYITIAGPISSLFLGILFGIAHFGTRDINDHLGAITWSLAFINITLGIFNLLPGFPLDGGRLLRSGLWAVTCNYRKATQIASRVGQIIAITIIGAGITMMVYSQVQGIWILAIGWFLMLTASSSYRQNQISQLFEVYKVRELIITDLHPIPSGTMIDTITSKESIQDKGKYFLVTRKDHHLGIISARRISKTPKSRRSHLTVDSIMDHIPRLPSFTPETIASFVLDELADHESSVALVAENGILLGLFDPQIAICLAQQRDNKGSTT